MARSLDADRRDKSLMLPAVVGSRLGAFSESQRALMAECGEDAADQGEQE